MTPTVSVVLNTYNRATHVRRAVDSVLSQSGVDLELVVVDDGSTDDTAAVLSAVADTRLRCLHQSNRGLSAARNVGARAARGQWLLFLDDDDQLLEGGLEALLAPTANPACRVVVGGVRFVENDGHTFRDRAPASLGHALAGSFLIHCSLFQEAGGYLEGLPCSHQTELFLRVRHVVGNDPMAAALVPEPVVAIERREAAGRPQRSPANAYFGGRWIAARHPDQYTSRRAKATLETIAAVNAMRIGREADARHRLATAIQHDPLSPGRYVRLAGAILTPIGRRFWSRQWETPPQRQRPLDRVRRFPDHGCLSGRLPLEHDPSPGPDSLFLPWRYRENPAPAGAVTHHPGSTVPVQDLAARIARAERLERVVDIGCLEGDLADGGFWHGVCGLKPQLVICADLVHRVPDPRRLLSGIRYAVSGGGMALVSTPDRTRQRPAKPMGPPFDRVHIREWSAEEFTLLLESCGLEILRLRRLPSASIVVLTRAV